MSFASKSNVAKSPLLIFATGHDKILFHFVVLAIKKITLFCLCSLLFAFLLCCFFMSSSSEPLHSLLLLFEDELFFDLFFFDFLDFFLQIQNFVSIANPKSFLDGARRKWKNVFRVVSDIQATYSLSESWSQCVWSPSILLSWGLLPFRAD